MVRRSASRSFNCVSSDQALKQMVNKEGMTKGGRVGPTLRIGVLTRWLKTRHVTSEYAESFTSLFNNTAKGETVHPEFSKSRVARDVAHVCMIMGISRL